MLPVAEQAKLIYVFSCYFGLVLLNVAAYFGVANTVRQSLDDAAAYRRFLARRQLVSGVVLALAIAAGLFVLGESMGARFGLPETLLVVVFLASQQLVDFVRRSAYVFASPRDATRVSLFSYGGRSMLLIMLQPESFLTFLLAVSAPAFVVAGWFALGSGWLRRGGDTAEVEHWRLSGWLVMDAPLKWIGVHAPILLVGLLHSGEAAAVLGTVRALISFANVFLEQLETLVPRVFATSLHASGLALNALVNSLLLVGFIIWAFGLMALWLLEPWMVLLFDDFYRPWYALSYLLWSANGVFFLAKVLALERRVRRDTRMEFFGSVSGVAALAFSLALVPEFDAWGGALSLLCVQLGVLAGVLAHRRLFGVGV